MNEHQKGGQGQWEQITQNGAIEGVGKSTLERNRMRRMAFTVAKFVPFATPRPGPQ